MVDVRFRRDTAANWSSVNPVLANGEPGYEKDTGKLKIGTGSTQWSLLSYFTGGGDSAPPFELPEYLEQANLDSSYVSPNEPLSVTAMVRALFAKTTSATEHAATIYQAGTSGVDVASALNVVSDNPDSSAMYLSGTEKSRGTLKIAHRGYADASDASAAALSIDLQTIGSAARGLYLWSSNGGQTGDAFTVRVSSAVSSISREDFVVKASGRCGIGTGLGSAPAGQLEVAPSDDTTPGIVTRGRSSGTNQQEWRRPSDGAVRTRISAAAQLVTQEVAFFAGPAVQIGSTSTQVGGGSGVVGLTNAGTVPTTNPTGGGILYSEGGELKWRSSGGVINAITPVSTAAPASDTLAGLVELATLAEVATGTDTARAVTPEGVRQERIALKAEILGAGVPAALDTLDELAAALADDASYAATTTTALGNRVRVDTAAQGLNSTQQGNARTNIAAANASHTHGVSDLTATGTPSATTYLRGDNTWASVTASALADTGWVTAFTPAAPLTGTVRYRIVGGRICELEVAVAYNGSWNQSFTLGTLPTAARPLNEQMGSGWWNNWVPAFVRIQTGGAVISEQAAATARTSLALTMTYLVA